MDKFDELLKILNELDLTQTDEFLEDIDSKLYESHLKELQEVDKNLDVDKHRWYETSVTVYEFGGRYLGVRAVTDVWGDSGIDDIGRKYYFFEMKIVVEPAFKAI